MRRRTGDGLKNFRYDRCDGFMRDEQTAAEHTVAADALILQLQDEGLGRNRLLGCGIFIPHKSIAPVVQANL